MSSNSSSSMTTRSPRLRASASTEFPDAAALEAARESEFTTDVQLAYLDAVVKDLRGAAPSETPEPRIVPAPEPAQSSDKDTKPITLPSDIRPATIIKSLLAVALAVALGWLPVQRLLATTSAEAVVNARVITLRAPIEGEVSMPDVDTDVGSMFNLDQNILVVRNPRADSSHLANLRRERNQLRTNIGALEGKKQLLISSLEELSVQQERFRIGRIEQLEQRLRQADTDSASAEAQYSVAADAMKRAMTLRKTDAVSQAYLDKAAGDAHVAEQAVKGQAERRKGMLVELNAAKSGSYVGDSYNDTPQSAQRKMEVSLELSDVQARLVGSRAELESIEVDIAKEQERHDELSKAEIRSTVNGRIWEMLTAPGEHVNAGQDLVKLLDCGSAIVTASVSETAYQRLAVGQTATFRPRDGGAELKGTVVSLNGLSAVASNSAIQQNALSREPYHVTLRFPDLLKHTDCRIGRSGLVQFDTASAADFPRTY
ncbi:HlyD family efflux transporter periplasmic adaptor subunit [Hyphomicrobium sp.]|uniref:HlyD family secretion protein n=1 Tax=Hyphomicrobium sp. TaxID=82 RepID=UPI000FB53FB9|nr:HlyD family efflux transporter periplasmic adaptor subunit [Hyphomicrobium sp.]RUP08075.1 MAG: HlyD family efflux transporter periplasmic adaptor subunit [Hyphomicrobium sp.]